MTSENSLRLSAPPAPPTSWRIPGTKLVTTAYGVRSLRSGTLTDPSPRNR